MEDAEYSGGVRRIVVAAIACVTVLLLVQIFLTFRSVPLQFDEAGHYCRIGSFLQGTWRVEDCRVVALPGYHMLIASALRLTGDSSVPAARTVSFFFGLLCCIPIFGIARILDRKQAPHQALPSSLQHPQELRRTGRFGTGQALLRTLQVVTLPILLPFFPLLYTDILGLGVLLCALWAALKKRPLLAALLLTAAIAIRQNALLWLPLIMLVSLEGTEQRRLRRGAAFLLPLLAFGVFLWFNGGASLNRAAVTPAVSFSLGNVFFALFLFTALFLPLVLHQARKVAVLLTERRWVFLLLLVLFLLFLFGFQVTHPINEQGGQVRDAILLAVSSGGFPWALFFLSTVFALLTLFVTPLERRSFLLLYPIAFVSLCAIWMIETRYALPVLVLFLLLRKPMPWRSEVLQVAYNLLLCYWVFF